MRLRNSWLFALVLVAALVLAACPAPGAAPVGDTGAASDSGDMAASEDTMDDGMAMDWESVDPSGQTITFWYQHTREREEALQQIIADFNESNEWGITVNAEYQGGYGDIFNKMLPVLNSDDAPNLVVAYQNQAATYQLADSRWWT